MSARATVGRIARTPRMNSAAVASAGRQLLHNAGMSLGRQRHIARIASELNIRVPLYVAARISPEFTRRIDFELGGWTYADSASSVGFQQGVTALATERAMSRGLFSSPGPLAEFMGEIIAPMLDVF